MPVEIMILFMIVSAGVAAFYYVQGRTYKEINSDLRKEVKYYKTETKAMDAEVLYWKTMYKDLLETKNKTKTQKTSKKK